MSDRKAKSGQPALVIACSPLTGRAFFHVSRDGTTRTRVNSDDANVVGSDPVVAREAQLCPWAHFCRLAKRTFGNLTAPVRASKLIAYYCSCIRMHPSGYPHSVLLQSPLPGSHAHNIDDDTNSQSCVLPIYGSPNSDKGSKFTTRKQPENCEMENRGLGVGWARLWNDCGDKNGDQSETGRAGQRHIYNVGGYSAPSAGCQ